jgi:diguanylate cyclase (GGDEF)-like protein
MLQLLLNAEYHLKVGCWLQKHGRDGSMLWSPQLCQLLRSEEGSGQTMDQLLDVVAIEDRERVRTELEQSQLSGQAAQIEHRLRLKDGDECFVDHRCFTTYDNKGRPLYSIGTVQQYPEFQSTEGERYESIQTDKLTHLPNRAATEIYISGLISRDSKNTTITVTCLDIDHFQEINDTFGIQSGNRLIVWLARHLRDQIAPKDWLARLDSASFVIIQTDVVKSTQDAIQHGKRLQKSLRTTSRSLERLPSIHLSACIGISTWPGITTANDDPIQAARTALAAAQRRGPGKVQVYSQSLNATIREAIDLEQKLSTAIEKNELKLHYQLQFDHRGSLMGAEALLRWDRQGEAFIPCTRFIPVAEQSGLIEDIGSWTLRTAVQQFAEWERNNINIPKLSINVSAEQLNPDADPLDELITEICHQECLSPSRIELELTETALLKNPQDAARLLQRLKKLGVCLWVDDFGTGFSNLKTLQRLPLKGFKIDKSFVTDMEQDPSDYSIVRATIQLAHGLGLKSLAEGVESIQQLQQLKRLGCDGFQGFLLAKPMNAEETARKLNDLLSHAKRLCMGNEPG